MAKRSKKTTSAPKRSLRRATILALSLAFLGTLGAISLGTVIGRRGIPTARQEGCVTGTTRLFFNMSGGNEAPADKVAEFCTAILSNN